MLKVKKAQSSINQDGMNDWNQISQQLQLREIDQETIPRLLHEAIQEIFNLQGKYKSLQDGVQELWHRAGRPQ